VLGTCNTGWANCNGIDTAEDGCEYDTVSRTPGIA
jgi:hypothetical protein